MISQQHLMPTLVRRSDLQTQPLRRVTGVGSSFVTGRLRAPTYRRKSNGDGMKSRAHLLDPLVSVRTIRNRRALFNGVERHCGAPFVRKSALSFICRGLCPFLLAALVYSPLNPLARIHQSGFPNQRSITVKTALTATGLS